MRHIWGLKRGAVGKGGTGRGGVQLSHKNIALEFPTHHPPHSMSQFAVAFLHQHMARDTVPSHSYIPSGRRNEHKVLKEARSALEPCDSTGLKSIVSNVQLKPFILEKKCHPILFQVCFLNK